MLAQGGCRPPRAHLTSPVVETVWVLGDQLHRQRGALRVATPTSHRVLLIRSDAACRSHRWHRQRLHLVLTSIARFARELRAEGFEVDERRAPDLGTGLAAHVAEHDPGRVTVMAAGSWGGRRRLTALAEQLAPTTTLHTVDDDRFLCHEAAFAAWAGDRRTLRLEDFYRWQRRRLGYLMDGDEPAGGRWNYDDENREPPPRHPVDWPEPVRTPLDEVDRDVLADLPATSWGDDPVGFWPTSRAEALRRLDHAVTSVLPHFGPHEDAMLTTSWHLAHTLLSPALNLGLLHPAEVCDAAEAAYREGRVPIASAEGFIRQIIGWREYVWGTYWLWMPDYRRANELDAHRPLPPVFDGGTTAMRCLAHVLDDIRCYAWTHHIPRLMILGNLCLLAGVDPAALVEWMGTSFVDGAEWVMVPNVIGMALHADGGRMATKPYAAGGAYIDRMSDFCRGCAFDRRQRTGPDACPFTTLYWDFIDRHRDRFLANPRVARQVRAADRLGDLAAVRTRAVELLTHLDAGAL